MKEETPLISIITLIGLVSSIFYMIMYFIFEALFAGLFNLIILALYSISFIFVKQKLIRIAGYWSISVYLVQVFFLSFIFFSKETGLHFFFLVIPLVMLLINGSGTYLIKIIYSCTAIFLFFLCELISDNLLPVYLLTGVQNRLVYLFTIAFDISGMAIVMYFFLSEKEKMLREIQTAKNYAESLFSYSPCAIYTIDKNNKIIDFNDKAEAVSGYKREELIGKEMHFLSDSTAVHQGFKDKIIMSTLTARNGRIKTIERYSSILKDGEKTIGCIESFIDITDRIELEEFKADMERVIRHDLKTPLNSIIGFPEMMLEDNSINEENREILKIIRNSGQNMLNLINASQNLYKLEKGTYEFVMEECNLASIISHICINLGDIKHRKKCTIDIFVNEKKMDPEKELSLKSEKTLLYMILINIIKNALEASPSEGNVTINIEHKDQLVITVHNQGSVPMEIREHFFDKYVTSGKKNGTGLGTYSAKIMAGAIGADLDFETDEETGTNLILSIRK